MKHLLHPRLSLFLLGCLLVLGCGSARAQAPVAERLDVFFGETKQLTVDGSIDSFSATPDTILKVERSEGTPNQLSLVGVAGGSAVLSIKSGSRTLVYDVTVGRAPVRLYINLNESKRLTFPYPIDDTTMSLSGVVRAVQPDSSDKVLLVEARTAGKTTLTVYCKNEIYTYFVSTFENRGADVLEIQNSFSAKGYRNLTITFEKDQAIIGGTVPTQEELDDAVRIVKQFTQFVVVKANLGGQQETSEYTEQEMVIINNIQRIANVKGLIVRVKFPMPTTITSSTKTTSTGDYIEPTTTTTPQGGVVKGSGFAKPTTEQSPTGSGPTTLKPLENTTVTISRTENTSIPEKIFLYGDMDNDLDEAKVLRVARTFCPFIVNFLTVKDPIQLRIELRFVQVARTMDRNTGVLWQGNATGGPLVALGFVSGVQSLNKFQDFINLFTKGVVGVVNATATLELSENLGLAKLMRQSELFLTNGQPGWYSEGEVKYYVASSVTSAGDNPLQTLTSSPIFLGMNMDISPLNLVAAGGVEPVGQKLFGIPTSVGGSTSDATVEQNSDPTPDKIGRVQGAIQSSGGAPVIDNTVKYVDENGMIGLNISTQLTVPNGAFQQVNFGDSGQFITLPDFFVRTTRTRANLRDGQTVAIDGLLDSQASRKISQVPFFAQIPFFSSLFKNPVDSSANTEVVVLVTPHLVRMRDPDSSRFPRPKVSEMEDIMREDGRIPIIKPVRYDAQAVDLRSEADPKEVAGDPDLPSPPGMMPRASANLRTLQPVANPSATASVAVDKKPSAPDISRHPSSAPLAPSSTLP